jgi:O-antigen/teichoic acid export membrane protein
MDNKDLFKKFISFSYGGWISLFIGIGSSMITTRILSPDIFGRTTMYTLAINLLMVLIILGTDQAFVRFFYEEEDNNRTQLLYNCLKIPMILFIIIALLIFWNCKSVAQYLFDESNELYSAFLIAGLFFNIVNRFGILVVRMHQKGRLYSNLQILNKLLNTVLIVVIYFLIGERIEVIIASTIITLFTVSSVSIISERKFWKKDKCTCDRMTINTKDIVKFSYPFMFTTLVFWLFQSFDKIALREWSTFYELGLYSASFRIIALITVIQTTFTAFWSPICYEHYKKNPEDTHFFEKMNSIISFAMLAIGIITIAFKDVIVLLLGSDYRATANIMPFLVFIPVMYTISETTVIGINFKKKTNWHVIIATISCTSNIIGNMILVPRYGAVGASASTAFSYILFFLARTVVSSQFYKIEFNLSKIFLFIALISMYAIYSILIDNIIYNLIIGVVLLVLLMIFYNYEIKYGFNFISEIIKNKKM